MKSDDEFSKLGKKNAAASIPIFEMKIGTFTEICVKYFQCNL